MSVEVLALNSTAATSDSATLADGASALLVLANADGKIPPGAHVTVQVQDAGGHFIDLIDLTAVRPSYRVEGPCVYRVKRPAGVSLAVDRADATPITTPANTVAPAITGTATTGNVQTCSQGTWTTPGRTTTYAYQWRRAGVNIVGQITNQYTLQAGDVGQAITCMVTATNPLGSTSQVSNTVTPAS